MIRKADILDRASEWQLRADVVEKDYVLGWLLAALARHRMISSTWVFKGGTCLKKCYFETYRFSEDLDFTIRPGATYDPDGLRGLLSEVAQNAVEMSGIEFPLDLVTVETKKDKLGRPTFRARIAYSGPLAHPGRPRVLLDLTQHEPVLDGAIARPIHHPYPDELPPETRVQCYSLDELLAEKTRALVERTRPRDLYDVVYVLENLAGALNLDTLRQVFRGKCKAKGIAIPGPASIVALAHGSEELRSEWANMLGHQLPLLPEIEGFLSRLSTLLNCLEEAVSQPLATMVGAPLAAGETVVVDSGARFWGSGVPLEMVRFAGANRLLVEFDYHVRHRIVEPYSLRTARTGNLLLYAWERGAATIKAFKVGEIQNLRPTPTRFTPKYRIEFTEGGPLRAPAAASTSRDLMSWMSSASHPSQGASSRRYGPTYVFACPLCQKEFRHRSNDPKLRSHNTAYESVACSGRRGYLVRTE